MFLPTLEHREVAFQPQEDVLHQCLLLSVSSTHRHSWPMNRAEMFYFTYVT